MVVLAVVALVGAALCAITVRWVYHDQGKLLAQGQLYREGTDRLQSAIDMVPWIDRLGIALGLLGVLFAGLATGEPLLTALVVLADVLALALLALRTRAARHADAESIHERLERIRVISRETATKSPVRK